MHVKAAVADSRIAFLSSANLTEAALERNMELGVLIRGGHLPAAIDVPVFVSDTDSTNLTGT